MVRFLALLALLCALTCPALAKGFPFNIPLYYNPNGGRYFHTLSNCDAIDPKYWDGMVSFMGDELDDAPYNALRPCQMCDADANLSSLPPESTLQNSVIDFPIRTTISSEEHARYLALYTADCERAYADYGYEPGMDAQVQAESTAYFARVDTEEGNFSLALEGIRFILPDETMLPFEDAMLYGYAFLEKVLNRTDLSIYHLSGWLNASNPDQPVWWIMATDYTRNYRTIYTLYLDARTGVLLAAKRN